MLKYASSFFFEKILPSVVATVAGAYIVNHYVAGKPADAPAPAAVSSAAAPDKAGSEIGVRARGASEKAIATAPAEKVQPDALAEKTTEKRADTAPPPAELKKHQAARREKAAARVASVPATPAQTASIPDDPRDANDLARAAIDRLRGPNDASPRMEGPRSQWEATRTQQDADRRPVESALRLQDVARAAPRTTMQPLPPPIQVSAPAVETPRLDGTGTGEGSSSNSAEDRARLPVPPADIPQASGRPDPEANAAARMSAHATVADDMLSAAKSVVQAVLPK
jgi:hypothetical protein